MQAEQTKGSRASRWWTVGPSSRYVSGRGEAPLAVSTRGALIGVIVALCGVGLVMVLSASAWTSLTLDGSVWTIFERQALWMGIGA